MSLNPTGIGGFTAVPNPLMIGFSGAQTYYMAKIFGIASQGGKMLTKSHSDSKAQIEIQTYMDGAVRDAERETLEIMQRALIAFRPLQMQLAEELNNFLTNLPALTRTVIQGDTGTSSIASENLPPPYAGAGDFWGSFFQNLRKYSTASFIGYSPSNNTDNGQQLFSFGEPTIKDSALREMNMDTKLLDTKILQDKIYEGWTLQQAVQFLNTSPELSGVARARLMSYISSLQLEEAKELTAKNLQKQSAAQASIAVAASLPSDTSKVENITRAQRDAMQAQVNELEAGIVAGDKEIAELKKQIRGYQVAGSNAVGSKQGPTPGLLSIRIQQAEQWRAIQVKNLEALKERLRKSIV